MCLKFLALASAIIILGCLLQNAVSDDLMVHFIKSKWAIFIF